MNDIHYAIGDIHGDYEQMMRVLDLIYADGDSHGMANPHVIFIGDLVDRQPNSMGVIEYLITGLKDGANWTILKGNHDRLFQWFLEDPHRVDHRLRPDYNWLTVRMGGRDTLKSYGVDVAKDYDVTEVHDAALQAVPQDHYNFIRDLELCHDTKDHFFVHAGVDPTVPLDEQDEDDMLWIRNGFLEQDTKMAKLIVHGHTVIDQVTNFGNRVNIDTGAAWGDELSTVVVDPEGIFQLTKNGRVLIKPTPEARITKK